VCKNLVPEIEGILEKQEGESGSVRGAAKTAVTGRQRNPDGERLTERDYLDKDAWTRMAFSFNTEE